uniref:Uncharacterized protein n=1 Tax=Phenylobacterium glaciei TaxID=2803784 RepID=A0A974P2L8_9CAUL|nr:hypothetical protein JKL49_22020 [Phenylobacterium glaciei]
MSGERIRRASLAASAADVKATLTYYPAGLVQPDHGHGDPHISLVLTGDLRRRRPADGRRRGWATCCSGARAILTTSPMAGMAP